MIHNCFKCDKALDPVFEDTEEQHYDAVIFRADGNYGSTVFDPSLPRRIDRQLIMLICDECLLAGKDRVLLREAVPRKPRIQYEEWDPERVY